MAVVIGVTGAIAAGKSHLCRYLVRRLGALHVDADEVAHAMYAPGTPGFARVVEEFGPSVVGADGAIDRAVLGRIVFGQPERMRALATAMGDMRAELHAVVEGWRATLPPDGLAVLEAIYLIEEGYAGWCDATWLVAADETLALPRLMARNGLTEVEARVRLDAATPWQDRAPACDRLFFNDGALPAFEAEIDEAAGALLADHRDGRLLPSRWHAWRAETDAVRPR